MVTLPKQLLMEVERLSQEQGVSVADSGAAFARGRPERALWRPSVPAISAVGGVGFTIVAFVAF
jgi:hypothetical protein